MTSYFSRFGAGDYPVGPNNQTKKLTNLSQYTAIFSKLADDVSYYTYYNVTPDERYDTISYKLYDTVDYYWTIPLLNQNVVNTFDHTLKSVSVLDQYLMRKYPGYCMVIDESTSLVGAFRNGEQIEYRGSYGTGVYQVVSQEATTNQLIVNKDENGEMILDPSVGTVVGRDSGVSLPVSIIVRHSEKTDHFIDANSGGKVPYFRQSKVPVSIAQVERDRNESYSQIKVLRPEYVEDVVDQFYQELRGSNG